MTHNIIFVVYLALAVVLSGLHISYMLRRDRYATEKVVGVAAIWTYIAAAIIYALSLYYFYAVDNTYMLHFILGVVMLVCLPAMLVTVSVATITGGNV